MSLKIPNMVVRTARFFLLASLFCGVFVVSAYPQQSVKLYPKVIRILKGQSKTITAAAYNSASSPNFNATFTFTVGNSSMVGVSNALFSGDDIDHAIASPPNLRTITGNLAGTTTITATWNGNTSDVATIIVDDPASQPSAIIHGDNDASGGQSINARVGEAIELDADSSRGVSKIEWVWGDGDKTSELLSTTHAYLMAGTYDLQLRVTNSSGQVATSNVTVNITAQPAPTRTITVSTIQQLLNAYNSATGGEDIVIPAGTVLTGEVSLPAKNFSDYVTIRSSAVMPDLKDRVSPTQNGLVTFRSNGLNVIPFTIKNGASKIRLAGLKFDPKYITDSNGASTYYLLQIGEAFTQTNTSQNPSKIIVQHCVINPPDDVNVVHAVLNDGYKVSIISSWIGNVKTFDEGDSQAIASFDGKGAHVYNNNYLEAATENIMYGGVVPNILGLISTNIEIRRCYFTKRLAWRVYSGGSHKVNIKNLLETKNARRLYVEGTVFENHWDAGRSQQFALVFKTAVSSGGGEFVPQATSDDIVVENSKLNHIYGGLSGAIDGYEIGSFVGLKPHNIVIKNALFDDLSERWGWPGSSNGAKLVQPNGMEDIKFDHVTVIDKDRTAGSPVFFATGNNFRFTITNTVFGLGGYGIIGSGVGGGIAALNPGTSSTTNGCSPASAASWNVSYNVIVKYSTDTSCYPTQSSYHNSFPANYSNIGFVDLANGNYKLSASSPYRGVSSDGSDPGVDVDLLNSRTGCSVSGSTSPCMVVSAPSVVSISGRLTDASTRSVSRAVVEMTDSTGTVRRSFTNQLGYYKFQSIPVGMYTFVIRAKNRNFTSSQLSITQSSSSVNFTSN